MNYIDFEHSTLRIFKYFSIFSIVSFIFPQFCRAVMRHIVGHWIVSSLSCCRVTAVTKFAAILIPIRTTGELDSFNLGCDLIGYSINDH